MPTRGLRRTALAALGAGALASCALGDFRRVDGELATGGGGSGSGGSSAGGCDPAGFPAPPKEKELGGTVEFVAAVHSIHLTEFPDRTTVGVDLDGTCTCELDAGSTCAPSEHSVQAKSYCDGERGRDNALGGFLKQASALLTKIPIDEFYSEQAHKGYWGLVLKVRGYNGEANDDQVTLALIGTHQFGVVPPKWDGTDTWPASSTSFEKNAQGEVDPEKPLYLDTEAYVTNNVLVASLPETHIDLAGIESRIAIRATGGGILARIAKDERGWRLDKGLVTGRLGHKEVMEMVASYRSDSGEPLCTDDAFYCAAKLAFCDGLDILKGLGNAAQPCDAISFAIGFFAEPASIGNVLEPKPATANCAPGTSPELDSCFETECPPPPQP